MVVRLSGLTDAGVGEHRLRLFLLYGLTVVIETPILMVALSACHSRRSRLFAGFWLTACTYPVVVLVLPALISPTESRAVYLLVAETFAPLAECFLFWITFDRPGGIAHAAVWRDFGAITAANLASFAIGELIVAAC